MATTNHLDLVLLEQSQAQKDVTMNEALARIDAVLNCGAQSAALATPPGAPEEGDLYIVADSATDDWQGQENRLAYYDGGIWRFIAPNEGVTLWVADAAEYYRYDGSVWQAETDRTRGFTQAQYHALSSLNDAATIDWNVQSAPMAEVTLGGNRTLANPTGAAAGGVYRLIIRQDSSGGHTLSFGGDYHFPAGSAPTITAAADATDMLTCCYDGAVMLCRIDQAFA